MLDATQQVKFAKHCGDAAFGYAQASMAAYSAMLDQSVNFWQQAAGAASGKTRRPVEPAPVFPFMTWPGFPGFPGLDAGRPARTAPVNPMLAFWDPSQWGALCAAAPANAFNPWTAWWDMFASPRAVTANPMAIWMMSYGVPRSVALPAAEANAAALDAADTASASINTTFSSYRSQSGYAVAQVISPKQVALSLMYGPVGAAMLMSWPWANTGSNF